MVKEMSENGDGLKKIGQDNYNPDNQDFYAKTKINGFYSIEPVQV